MHPQRESPPPPTPTPDPRLTPLTCPSCGVVSAEAHSGRCPHCGAAVDRDERLIEEYGPEAFVPKALPWQGDYSGPAMIAEAGLVVALGMLLMVLVYRYFGGWTWTAALFALAYWGCYGLVRRRHARRTLRAIVDAFRLDAGTDQT